MRIWVAMLTSFILTVASPAFAACGVGQSGLQEAEKLVEALAGCMSAKVPAQLGDGLAIKSVSAEKRILVWSLTMDVPAQVGGNDIDHAEAITRSLAQQFCEGDDMKVLFDKGASMRFEFSHGNGQHIASTAIPHCP